MSIYGVIVKIVDGDTGGASLERFGEVVDLETLAASDDRGRDFCDGQTSPIPPEHADDPGGMIFTYTREAAEHWSGVVRNDLASRAASGDILLPDTLSWLTATQAAAQAAAYAETVLAAETLPATIAEVRESGVISATITDSQIQSQIQAYVAATGHATPSIADLLEWITDNAAW